ncbi:MAG: hypothetical protein IJC99_00035 [Clostridia bacterium]|nr:hypothetical protein [Clostridia bacterium]
MLKYSRASVGVIKQELASISFFVTLLSTLLMMTYLVYAIVVGYGILAANIALCMITAINFCTYILMHRAEKRGVKNTRNWIKHACRIAKLCINAVSIATIAYAVVTTPDEVSAGTLVLLPMMIIFWVLQAILEMVTLYVKSRIDLLLAGLQLDFDHVITPIAKVKNMMSAVMGEASEEPAPVSAHHERLLKRRAEQAEVARKEKWKRRAGHVLGRVLPHRKKEAAKADARECVKK